MNVFTIGLLYHFAAVQRLLPKYGLQASIDVADGVLVVRGRNRYYRFYPQYLCYDEGGPRFSPELEERARYFIGWRPYFNKRWPAAFDKLAFKDYCRSRGIRTPALSRLPSPELRDFIVKRNALSFGKGMRGPFRAYDAANPAQRLGEDGYYEAFVAGQIVKASYWNDALAALELKPQPKVAGDGKRSVRELIALILRPGVPKEEWRTFADVAAYQALDLDAVPAPGAAVMVDFRFATYVEAVTFDNPNELRNTQDSALIRELRDLGALLYQSIPEDLRECTLYSVDAVLDAEQRLWLLEMNCNPACHPDCYEAMFTSLFGAPEAAAAGPVPPQTALPPYQSIPRLAAAVAPPPPPPPAPPPAAPLPARRWLA